jgi:hypothetical protein
MIFMTAPSRLVSREITAQMVRTAAPGERSEIAGSVIRASPSAPALPSLFGGERSDV